MKHPIPVRPPGRTARGVTGLSEVSAASIAISTVTAQGQRDPDEAE
jgi:hypothetical protein